MNANELAQEFEEYLKEIEELPWGNHQILCDQAATMLRQQAEQINNLQQWEKRYLDLIDTLKYEKSSGVYEDEPQAEELFEIMKSNEMNNEPVAWIDPRELDMAVSTSVTKHKQFDGDIPLYTYPAKTLTDEDLFKVYADLQENYTGNNFPVDLGRAILRKAQEK